MKTSKWFAGLILFCSPLLHAATLDPSIIHQWKLDETSGTTAYDSVGGWDLQLNGGATFAPSGSGVNLDGSSGYMLSTSGDTSFLNSNFTITLWEIFSGFTGKPGMLQFVGPNNGSLLGLDLSYPTLDPFLDSAFQTSSTQATINDGTQHLISIVKSGSSITLYLDSTIIETGTYPRATVSSSGVFSLGKYDATHFFGGTLDDVTIYNRALSQSEIAAQAVPEPGAWGLLGLGAIGWMRRSRKA
jgi:hypothetical protein